MVKSDIVGKVALVTGASKGIGKAISLRLAEMGVKVAINFNTSTEAAESVAGTIKEGGGEAFTVHADVSNLNQVVDRVVDDKSGKWRDVTRNPHFDQLFI